MSFGEGIVVQLYAHSQKNSPPRKLRELTTDESGNCDVSFSLRENEKAFIVLPALTDDETGNPLWTSREFSSYKREITQANFFGFRRRFTEEEIKHKWLESRAIHSSPNTLRFFVPDDVFSKIEAHQKTSLKLKLKK